jgi:type VI secretion system protein ImpE
MPAEQSLREGKIEETLAQLQEQVRKDPSNAKHRVFLFQLLSILGDWKRAMTQLSVLKDLDASTIPMTQAYAEALKCEALRADIFAGQRSPLVFGEPEQWIALMAEALRLGADGKHAQAQELRGQALEAAPATSGTIDGTAFEWIADADSRLGPLLEVVVNGRYYWVPFHRILRIDIEKPADLRDFVWMPAHFAWSNGGEAVGLIPTRYPGSETSEDPQIRMARKTDWVGAEGDTWLGLGQRMLATDVGEYPLMAVREIRLEAPADPGESA